MQGIFISLSRANLMAKTDSTKTEQWLCALSGGLSDVSSDVIRLYRVLQICVERLNWSVFSLCT